MPKFHPMEMYETNASLAAKYIKRKIENAEKPKAVHYRDRHFVVADVGDFRDEDYALVGIYTKSISAANMARDIRYVKREVA